MLLHMDNNISKLKEQIEIYSEKKRNEKIKKETERINLLKQKREKILDELDSENCNLELIRIENEVKELLPETVQLGEVIEIGEEEKEEEIIIHQHPESNTSSMNETQTSKEATT